MIEELLIHGPFAFLKIRSKLIKKQLQEELQELFEVVIGL